MSDHTGTTTPAASIENIRDAIRESISQVDQIPAIKTDAFDSETVKADLRRMLEEAHRRTFDVAAVFQNLDAIRNEIVNPVNIAIRAAARPGNWFGSLGFAIGVLGLVLTIITLRGTPPSSSQPPARSPIVTETDAHASGIIAIETGVGADNQLAYDKIQAIVRRLESVLVENTSTEAGKIEHHRDELTKVLRELSRNAANEPRVLSVAIYGLLLCATVSKDWEKVHSLAQHAVSRKLLSSDNGFAIRAYLAEALARRHLLSDALNAYRDLAEDVAVGANPQTMLSPENYQRMDGRSFVARRIAELTLQRDLSNANIWIYDMETDGSVSAKSAQTLASQGLPKTFAKGKWGRRYSRPYIFFRKASPPVRQKLHQLVMQLADGTPPGIQEYVNASDDTVRQQFDRNTDMEYLIILPQKAPNRN